MDAIYRVGEFGKNKTNFLTEKGADGHSRRATYMMEAVVPDLPNGVGH